MPTPRATEPLFIRQGDAVAWNASYGDGFNASTYTLKYRLVNEQNAYNIQGAQITPSGNGWLVTLASTDTSAYAPGVYTWFAFAYDASNQRFPVSTGRVVVQADVAAGPVDLRSPNEKMLAAINLLLTNRAADVSEEYAIQGRHIKKLSPQKLEEWRGIYAWRVYRERKRKGMRVPPTTTGVRFGGNF